MVELSLDVTGSGFLGVGMVKTDFIITNLVITGKPSDEPIDSRSKVIKKFGIGLGRY